MRCVCGWFAAAWEERGRVDERIGFGLYQRGGVLGVCLDQGLEEWCYVCVTCESGLFV